MQWPPTRPGSNRVKFNRVGLDQIGHSVPSRPNRAPLACSSREASIHRDGSPVRRKQNKAKQSKTKQNRTKQNETEQAKPKTSQEQANEQQRQSKQNEARQGGQCEVTYLHMIDRLVSVKTLMGENLDDELSRLLRVD